jgi:S-adenosylmethionine-diacylglycerol 3-amino-3-carboxypropyl transferase
MWRWTERPAPSSSSLISRSPSPRPAPEAPATIADAADFSLVRYAQCWEDADVLLEALDVRPGDVCLSIVSGGDNTLSLLSRAPARVIAVDLSPAQMACLELKAEACRCLEHPELLELVGATPSPRRPELYRRIRSGLSPSARAFWDTRTEDIARGIGHSGKFERYFQLFRERVLPLIHPRSRIEALFVPRTPDGRRRFYRSEWDNRRWRLLFRLFFSRAVMGKLGRDPSFFRYVEGSVASRILARTERALTELDPSQNPYLQWIALGRFADALPHWLRAENLGPIRACLDRIERRVAPVEVVLAEAKQASIDRFNMSDIFEYVSGTAADRVFDDMARAGRSGGRIAYWNMLVARHRPERLAHRLRPAPELSERLRQAAKTFFYSALVVEDIG